jgi:hypothetical protein
MRLANPFILQRTNSRPRGRPCLCPDTRQNTASRTRTHTHDRAGWVQISRSSLPSGKDPVSLRLDLVPEDPKVP